MWGTNHAKVCWARHSIAADDDDDLDIFDLYPDDEIVLEVVRGSSAAGTKKPSPQNNVNTHLTFLYRTCMFYYRTTYVQHYTAAICILFPYYFSFFGGMWC